MSAPPTVPLLPHRLPSARRAAVFLAVLLVPVTALAGTVVCAGPGGASTPWSPSSDCPRRALKTLPAQPQLAEAGDIAAVACVALPGVDAGVTAEAASVPTTPPAFLLLASEPEAPVLAHTPEPFTERGPPLALHRAIRSVVLRI